MVAKMVATCYVEKLHLKYNKPQIFTQFDPFSITEMVQEITKTIRFRTIFPSMDLYAADFDFAVRSDAIFL